MKSEFPTAAEYAAEKARHEALTIVDVHAQQRLVTEPYRNDVLSNVNDNCVRLAVFEGNYRWHFHPDSDELFLVVAGKLQIELAGGKLLELSEWQSVVIPSGTVHRTRGIGRTVNLTFEKQGANAVFVDGPEG